MSHFWWGDEDNQKRMHWMAWWKMCVPKDQGGMGFRDIHCFNLALLAKQAWRLLDNPDSLCATILRAKYFPDGDLMNASLKKGSSFTWQSIMAGVDSLKKGYIWRVGNGQNIDIWRDAWIPNGANRKIITPRRGQLLTKVADLIDPINNCWDEDLVRQTLWPIDVQRVLTIPLPTYNMSDFIAWSFTKNGLFTVRSAYLEEWKAQHGRKLQHSDGIGGINVNTIWSKIWKLSCPAKVKIFIWRTLHGTLPCRVTLANRHMKVSPTCPSCSNGHEDTKHLLFLCQKAKEVWEKLGLHEAIKKACAVDRAGEAVLEFLIFMPEHELSTVGIQNVRELIAITAWYLWWERRSLVHQGKTQDAYQISMGARAITTNYVIAQSSKATNKIEGWTRPPLGFVKLNVDASFDQDMLRGTAGAVLRDDKGRFIVGGNWKMDWCADVLTAEAMALRFGLLLAQKAGSNRLVVNSDNMEVIDTMKNGGHTAGAAAAVFDDCYFMACDFPLVRFEHCNRKANKVAHEIARVAKFSETRDWFEEPLNDIVNFLIDDVTIITNK